MKRRVIIAGKGASGKDYLRKILVDAGFVYSVSHTTRPPRRDEVDGKDYYFIEKQEALKMIERGSFIEHTFFNDWIYGTSEAEFFESDLFILTPSGIAQLSPKNRDESYVLYLDIEEEVRRERMSERKDADDVERRLKADESDFYLFSDYDYRVKDSDFSKVLDLVLNVIKIKEEND
jgi:guanylate kinase